MERKYIILIIIAATVVALLIIIIPIVVLLNVDKCLITLNDLSAKHPLILHRSENKFIWPEQDNIIYLTTGQSIRLVCSGNNNELSLFPNVNEVVINCVANKTFTFILDNSEELFDNITCNKTPESILIPTEKSCGNYFTELEIGFYTSLGVVPLITTCFDEIKKDSLYSKYTLSKTLKYSKNNEERSKIFQEGIYYNNLKPHDYYSKFTQSNWFEELLGSSKYIDKNSNYFLSRGHLTPYSHFNYHAQRNATMYFVNVAPQWQIFNGGNWKALEEDTRDLAYNHNNDLIVYTGIYGNAQLSSSKNRQVDLYMHKFNDTTQVLTVPEVYWKMLYEPRLKYAIVFVGHNNPYEENIASKRLCSNICNRINWLKWKADNVSLGFSYCCDYYEFKKVVNYLPDLVVYGILT